MARAFLLVMDSVGCGGAPDAAAFGDVGANTLGAIADYCAQNRPEGPLHLPNLARLGLWQAVETASGYQFDGGLPVLGGRYGAATECSKGKDTPTGHWELAGVPLPWDWTYFPDRFPALPPELVAEICRLAGTDGILGNCHASGIKIIERHIEAHLLSGWPIVYTSSDSVVQIAAHAEVFGGERLYQLCADLAPQLHAARVARVIARPFIGKPGAFSRTAGRRDYALMPPAPTLLDWAQAEGCETHGVGKIGDIFSMRGITHLHRGDSDAELATQVKGLIDTAPDRALIFANFVEFDTLYGHLRDPAGYAGALERFDRHLGEMLTALRAGDLLIVTADHGNDPSFHGTEHTRERVPVLCAGLGAGEIGIVDFADVGASVAAHLGLAERGAGRSFL